METSVAPDQLCELSVLLFQANDTLLRARDNELRQFGISVRQAAVLFTVKAVKGPATPAEISRWLFREPHTVSGLLNRMEKQGLVRKVKNLERKNLIRVVLTEKGEEAYQQARESKVIRKILSCLSLKERNNLGTYLDKLRNKALGELGGRKSLPFP